ncbi:MAG: phage tail protein [Gammaproteobacteria bacterium]|nr:phage tail protein [Gammaproteobacteria bacterium]
MSEPFIGEIKMVGFNFAPKGWAECDGQILDNQQHSSLFALLGNTYGGDGRTNFALPDLRARMAIHEGQGPGPTTMRNLGSSGGLEEVALHEQQMPAHSHSATPDLTSTTPVNLESGSSNSPNANNTSALAGKIDVPAGRDRADVNIYNDTTATNSLKPADVEGKVTIGNTGGGLPHDNMPPFLTVNFVIALQGKFPPRN